MTAFDPVKRMQRRAKTASGFGLALISILSQLLSSCFGPTHTDIDYIGETYVKERQGFEYLRNCKKTQPFFGLGKFRVSCIVSKNEDAWSDSFNRSHASFSYFLKRNGFEYSGSVNHPDHEITENDQELPIAVFSKKVIRDDNKDCERRLYLDFSEMTQFEISNIPSGVKLVLADPKVLHCTRSN